MKLPDQKWPHNTADITSCCGSPTHIDRYIVPTRMITNPPPTKALHIEISHWQCLVTEDHFGDTWSSVPEEGIAHRNVFEDNDNDTETGDENQQRN